jgi:hypothetical protein
LLDEEIVEGWLGPEHPAARQVLADPDPPRGSEDLGRLVGVTGCASGGAGPGTMGPERLAAADELAERHDPALVERLLARN